ncbi:sigma-70 family RNA polymerase sigma factor [Streptomyces europaeiscabiei]|uniref:sigma-70 family RNA polymerase sigma factor n=1 Tax=Streptomyces TaxID=1883 RepID=UPI000A3AD6F4|nr:MULTISPECIES: sigma-70 family RNA polymerase sigma factor [Streptomyces]MDX3581279.1 sigma-70 family RNA polymerase sigma factor [Streptomyces europaeiscabiei]MDX3617767.1 sigma-70 family RNA polymerase sigma factor [Streptomyces europaeiscabiei]MDX3636447.1 sigma-70 family RNA polymerase sigma factor [Streptomyces europaeiscabiei]MDX3654458.1 sigma-70 family RNA polymerase sigma factor [Streptomyces europaeiscabiei]WUD34206.1 sigma-70 family RNA polymerase sigma factor [Streptomyces europa
MSGTEFLAGVFEEHRSHLRAVAYRMLGSLSDADDAVQEAWLKLNRSDVSGVQNLGGWLTTVVSRVCLDMLRSRATRREESLHDQDGRIRLPDPVVSGPNGVDPEQEILVADSVGIALMIVLQTLSPAERLAFVLHDLFAVPFDEIGPVLGRTAASTRQLASRARRRVNGAAPVPDTDLARRRQVVDAFLTASRGGDFEALLAVLDPEVVARSDGGALRPSLLRRGAAEVASQAITFARFAEAGYAALVNGTPGVVAVAEGRALSVMAFTIQGGRITAIDILTDPERLARIDLGVLGG